MKAKLFFIVIAIFSLNANAQIGQQNKSVADGNHQFYNVDDIDYLCTRNSFEQDFITNPKAFNTDVLKQLFKFQDKDSLVSVKDRTDIHGSRIIEFEQYHSSVKVYQSSIKVLYDVNAKLVSISGAWYSGEEDALVFKNTSSTIDTFVFSKKNKTDLLVNNLSKTNQLLKLKVDPKPNFKKVYVITNEGLKPQWVVDLFFYKKKDVRLLIDDNSKTIANEISLDNYCDNSTVSTPHNGSRSFKSTEISGDYYSTNSCSGYNITAFDNHGNDNDDLSEATFYESPNSGFNSQSEIIGATNVWIMSEFDNYLTNVFGRNSWDDNGGDWVSICNTLVNGSANNASFSGSTGRFSFGRGSSSSSLDDDWIVIDIAGHEVSHGIDHHEGGLIYQNGSGAINEAFADCWGEVLERKILGSNDWLVGADRGAIRSLSNPHDFGDPSVYQGNDWYTGTGDYGGVHTNSGVMNHFFYLLVEGGSGSNEGNDYNISGIGMDDGANLLYKVLTDLVNSNTDYNDIRDLWLSAASSIFPGNSNIYNAVSDAWCAVGLGGVDCNEATLTNDDPCDALTLNVSNSCSFIIQNVNGATASNFDDPLCDNPVTIDVWYKFIVPSSGLVSLRTLDINLSNGAPDFGAEFYSSCSTNANAIACVQNSFSLGSSSYMPGKDDVDLSGYEGNTVYLRLFDHGSTIPSGSFEICLFDSNSSSGCGVAYTDQLVKDGTGGGVGNSDSQANPGEEIDLEVEIEALNCDLHNVTGILTTNDSDITITDDDRSWGTILQGQTDWTSDFDFDVDVNTPEKDVVFTLQITSDEGSWTLTFTVHIYAGALDVDNYTLKENIKLFPNPTSDFVNVLNSGNNFILTNIEVYNVLGVKVLEFNNDLNKINLQQLNSGTYFLKIYDLEKRSAIFKVIKQ